MQVAMVQFWGGDDEEIMWNLKSAQTANYPDLLENILTMNWKGRSGGDGRIQDGFKEALDDIVGRSSIDRPDAKNVVLTLGDGGGASGISNLNDMIANNDRYENPSCTLYFAIHGTIMSGCLEGCRLFSTG